MEYSSFTKYLSGKYLNILLTYYQWCKNYIPIFVNDISEKRDTFLVGTHKIYRKMTWIIFDDILFHCFRAVRKKCYFIPTWFKVALMQT